MFDGTLPTAEQFVEVVCEDISAGGFSFCLKQAPTFRYLVAGLGKPPAVVYFTAEAVRVQKKEIDGADGVPNWLPFYRPAPTSEVNRRPIAMLVVSPSTSCLSKRESYAAT